MSTPPPTVLERVRSRRSLRPSRSTTYHGSSGSTGGLEVTLPTPANHRPSHSETNLINHSSFRGMRRLEARRQMEETNYLASKARNLNPPTDFRLLDYVVPFDENLMCPICRCPFLDPVVLSECDHYFCRDCIRQSWASSLYGPHGLKGDCPSCRTPARLGPRSATSKILVNITDDLLVRCPKSDEGCTSQVKRGEVRDHLAIYCGYSAVSCLAEDCERPVRRKDVAQGCLHYGVSCLDCQATMQKCNLEAHWQTCRDRKITCKLCKEDIYHHSQQTHESETCPAALVPCPGKAFGCTTQSKRAEAELHSQSCTFAKLAPMLTTMQDRLSAHETAQKLLQRKLSTMETGFQTLQDILAASPADTRRTDLDQVEADETRIPFLSAHERAAEDLESATLDAFFGTSSSTPTNQGGFPVVPPSSSRPSSSRPASSLSLAQAPVSLPPPSSRPVPAAPGPRPTDLPEPYTLDFDMAAPSEQHYPNTMSFPPAATAAAADGGPYVSPLHHLLSMHESLRDEMSRMSAALQEVDGRHSMQTLNENLRTREEIAFVGAQVGGLGRQVHWLTSVQLQRQQMQSQVQVRGRNNGDGDGVEGGVEAVVSTASRIVRGATSVVDAGVGGLRRGASEEGRTKL